MVENLPTRDPLALIRKAELAKLLDVNPWTIDNWRKRGLIPQPICLSPQIVAWRRSDVDHWLRDRERNPVKAHEPYQNRLRKKARGGGR
jgi:predicted DNA-binding transcriptional regulator AlpA